MSTCAKRGRWRSAAVLLEEFGKRRLTPDSLSFSSLTSALATCLVIYIYMSFIFIHGIFSFEGGMAYLTLVSLSCSNQKITLTLYPSPFFLISKSLAFFWFSPLLLSPICHHLPKKTSKHRFVLRWSRFTGKKPYRWLSCPVSRPRRSPPPWPPAASRRHGPWRCSSGGSPLRTARPACRMRQWGLWRLQRSGRRQWKCCQRCDFADSDGTLKWFIRTKILMAVYKCI